MAVSSPSRHRPAREPTAGDFAGLVRLAGELGELADVGDRIAHAVTSFVALVGGRASVFAHIDCDPRTGRPTQLVDGACFGLDGNEFLFFGCDFFSGEIDCPIADAYRYGRGGVNQPTLVAPARSQVVTDAEWERSVYRNEILRPYGIDAVLVARYTHPGRHHDVGLSLMREPQDRPAGAREQRLVELFLDGLGPLFIPKRSPQQHKLASLSPRLRKVLDGLLAGQAPKQIARTNGLTLATVYEYTKRLYRHFDVSGRGELLALFVSAGSMSGITL